MAILFIIAVMFMNTEDITANLDHLKLTFIYHEQASLDQLVTLTPAGNEEASLNFVKIIQNPSTQWMVPQRYKCNWLWE